jgi:hypothetical protein
MLFFITASALEEGYVIDDEHRRNGYDGIGSLWRFCGFPRNAALR